MIWPGIGTGVRTRLKSFEGSIGQHEMCKRHFIAPPSKCIIVRSPTRQLLLQCLTPCEMVRSEWQLSSLSNRLGFVRSAGRLLRTSIAIRTQRAYRRPRTSLLFLYTTIVTCTVSIQYGGSDQGSQCQNQGESCGRLPLLYPYAQIHPFDSQPCNEASSARAHFGAIADHVILLADFWGPASNFGIPIAAVMDTQKDPELYASSRPCTGIYDILHFLPYHPWTISHYGRARD